MTVFGWHASHEQIDPGALLAAAQRAEEAGFRAAMCSDHLVPWSARQGQSAFAWTWLGAAMHATSLPFGVVNAPGQRYHPVIIAQAIGTLEAMFPGRFWAALGSGEAMNEHVTGEVWPRKDVRNARLRECVDVIRALLRGEEVSHDGLVTVDRARLYTNNERVPPLVGAAVSTATARWCAEWADGLITINQPLEKLREIVDSYRHEGGRGDLVLQVHLSWAPDEQAAEGMAYDQWRHALPPPATWDIDSVEVFDLASEHVPMEVIRGSVNISSDLGKHAEWLAQYAELGFDRIMLHHVGREQEAFIDAFGAKVLPQLAPGELS